MAEARFLRRSLAAAEIGALRVLDVLRWPTPLGSGLRVYLGRGAAAEALERPARGGIALTPLAASGGALVAVAVLSLIAK